jgi:cyclic-di-AMP phosphodiesterase
MKRWIFFTVALILNIISILIYAPFIQIGSGGQVLGLVFFFGSLILTFTALYIALNFQSRQKVRTLQNRLSMWTKLSYHVNQVGDEVFNELPIGILALDDEFEIKWANPTCKNHF